MTVSGRTRVRACTSALCSSSSVTTSGCRRATAHISAVCCAIALLGVDVGATSRAARARPRRCRFARPPSAASRRSPDAAFGVGALRRAALSTIAALPLTLARWSGVIAEIVRDVDLRAGGQQQTRRAPHRRRYAAQCSAVAPSPSGALTSTRFCSKRAHRRRVLLLDGVHERERDQQQTRSAASSEARRDRSIRDRTADRRP